MFIVTSFRIIQRACEKWSENGGTRLGAALAYYALFSLAPMMLIAIHITGALLGEEAVRKEVAKTTNAVMGPSVASKFDGIVKQAADAQNTNWTPTVSILFLVVAALGAFLHIRAALSLIWKLDPPRGNTWLGMLWDYVLSLCMVFLTALLILLSVTLGLAMPLIESNTHWKILEYPAFWRWFEVGSSFFFLTVLFAISYRTLSGGRISWGYVIYGSVIASMLFGVGKMLLGYYIEYSDPESAYGAAGSVVVFLIWVYYSSQVLFFGAEMIQARRTRREWLYNEKTVSEPRG
jgi:membrane protein